MISLSGAEHVARKAVDWLNLKFNSTQLMIPIVYQEIKKHLGGKKQGRGAPHCRTSAAEG